MQAFFYAVGAAVIGIIALAPSWPGGQPMNPVVMTTGPKESGPVVVLVAAALGLLLFPLAVQ